LSIRLAAAALVALALAGCDVEPASDRGGASSSREGRVTHVTDGDTIRIGEERIRLIGVDTPETHGDDECFGRQATAFMRRTVLGRRVDLELDVEHRDRYGRLLAYVRRRDDGAFVNAELVAEGYAQVLTVPPNVRHAKRFLTLQRRARSEGRGLWRAC
jgi:micrococcal nuclease